MKFTSRHARALTAGAITTAAYLASAKASDSRMVRASALLMLGVVATLSAQAASPTAKTTKKRLDAHITATAPAVHFVAQNGTALTTLALSSHLSWLATLIGPLPHQTTGNPFITTAAGSLSTADRNILNGWATAINNWMTSAQNSNIQS